MTIRMPNREPSAAPGQSICLVIPVHNEEASLASFMVAAEGVMDKLDVEYRLLFVDDGSSDGTLDALRQMEQAGKPVSVLKLSRNFGKEAALTAGIDAAEGDAVVILDVDLQDPPELIAEFLRLWRAGYDVVYGARRSRHGDGLMKRFTAYGFYGVFNMFSATPIPPDAGDFRLMDRRVIEAMKRLPERERFMKGLFAWVGFRHIGVPYDRTARQHGQSAWTYWRLFRFAVDGITSFSTVPLTIWTAIGFLISLSAALWSLFLIVRVIFLGIEVPGYLSTVLIILFMGGIQILGLGIMGEYLGRVYNEVKRRPIYVVDDDDRKPMDREQPDGPGEAGKTPRNGETA